jgi:hypothetical protein
VTIGLSYFDLPIVTLEVQNWDFMFVMNGSLSSLSDRIVELSDPSFMLALIAVTDGGMP